MKPSTRRDFPFVSQQDEGTSEYRDLMLDVHSGMFVQSFVCFPPELQTPPAWRNNPTCNKSQQLILNASVRRYDEQWNFSQSAKTEAGHVSGILETEPEDPCVSSDAPLVLWSQGGLTDPITAAGFMNDYDSVSSRFGHGFCSARPPSERSPVLLAVLLPCPE